MNKIKPTKEKLAELKKQTKDKFTKRLIDRLIREIALFKKKEIYEQLCFDRILNLIENEKMRDRLDNYKTAKEQDYLYHLRVTRPSGKKRDISVTGNETLNKLSKLIKEEFELEPGYLYEFQIKMFKFGPECDDWQEIFDGLDNFKICAAIGSANLATGDSFKFLYDFREKIKFKVEILDIKNGK